MACAIVTCSNDVPKLFTPMVTTCVMFLYEGGL